MYRPIGPDRAHRRVDRPIGASIGRSRRVAAEAAAEAEAEAPGPKKTVECVEQVKPAISFEFFS